MNEVKIKDKVLSNCIFILYESQLHGTFWNLLGRTKSVYGIRNQALPISFGRHTTRSRDISRSFDDSSEVRNLKSDTR